MKKINLILTMLFFIGIAGVYGQCNTYYYELTKTGFACDYSVGQFCFVANGNWTDPESECAQYDVDIRYVTDDITITDIGDYVFLSENNDYTTIRGTVNLTSDGTDYVCFSAIVNTPGTQLRLFIVNPETGDIVNPAGDDFYLDDEVQVGSDGQETLLSQAIADDLLLPASQAENTGQNVGIHGTLVIDEDYSFKNFSTLHMAAGSSIKVLSNITFNTTDAKFYTCNDEQWEGINVEQYGRMDFVKSEIHNASIAIDLKDLSECNVWGGKFYDNNIGIALLQESFHNDVVVHVEGSPWAQNEFSGGNVGIWIRDNQNSLVLNNWVSFNDLTTGIKTVNTSSNINYVTFTNCDNGVINQSSSSEWTFSSYIKNCTFQSNQNSIIVDGAFLSKIIENDINGGGTAIRRESKLLDEITYIEYNTISNVQRGIIANVKESTGFIQHNNISSSLTSIEVNGLEGDTKWHTQQNDLIETTVSYLPFLTSVYYNNVINGTIYKNDDISGTFGGITVDGGYFNHVGYNEVKTGGYNGIPTIITPFGIKFNSSDISGIYCNGTDGQTGLNILGDNSGTEVRENDMSSAFMGLEYGNQIQTFANTGEQAYKGNHFGVSSPENPKAINYSPAFVAKLNNYIVGTLAGNQGTDLFPFFISEYAFWFEKNNGGEDSHNCGNSNGGPNNPPLTVDDYVDVIKQDTGIVKKVKKHYGKGGVLHDVTVTTVKHILDYWDMGGTMFQDVLQDPDYEEAVDIVLLENQMYDILTIPVYDDNEINDWIGQMDNVNSEIADFNVITYDSSINNIEVHTDDPAYINLINKFNSLISTYSADIKSKQNIVDDEIGNLLVFLNKLPKKGSSYADLHKDILALAMKYQLSEFQEFTQDEKDMLNKTSDKCSYIYGEPVFMARALRATYDNNTPIYLDDCKEEKNELEPRMASGTNNYAIYPNPAKDNITIVTDIDQTTYFDIMDGTGKVIQSIKVIGSKQINTSDYQPGLYFLIDKSGQLQTKKFTIIK